MCSSDLAGSYAVEELTDSLERLAMDYIAKIDSMGGMLSAIEKGYPQREIQEAAYRYQQAVESENAIVVGVNSFKSDDIDQIPVLKVDPKIERDQKERLSALRSRRDASMTEAALSKVEEAARGTTNMLPTILDAVENMATVGEISNRLRKVWGEYEESLTV